MGVDDGTAGVHDARVLADALRKEMALAEVKPAELARRLGVAESTISRLASGQVQDVTVDRVIQIERALSLPAGRLFRSAGLVVDEDGVTVRQHLEADPLLAPDWARMLLRLYDSAVEASADERSMSAASATPATRSTRRS